MDLVKQCRQSYHKKALSSSGTICEAQGQLVLGTVTAPTQGHWPSPISFKTVVALYPLQVVQHAKRTNSSAAGAVYGCPNQISTLRPLLQGQ